MKKFLSCILGMVLLSTIILLPLGCGSKKKELRIYNWGDYMDKDLIKEFENRTNIKVRYNEFATNEEMYVKLKNSPGQYDLAIPSDYMITKMVNEGLLEKIDFNNIKNYAQIDSRFKHLPFDPNNEYSVPYMWGTLGIIYNTKMIKDEITSWNDIWNPKYKGQILMLDSQRDSIGIALKKLGYSVNSKNTNELNKAKEELMKQKPLVYAYVGDEVKDQMVEGEAAIAVVWSGDALTMMENNENLEYVIPKEGTNLWFDNMVIPKGSEHKKEAEMFINFMTEAEISKKNVEYIGYSTPNKEAQKLLPKEIIENPTAYPSDEVIKKSEVFIDLGNFIKEYDKVWTNVKAK
ncbi:spermidine/putrescine ABC transporter substrate-binding protein [Hathewaya histolytica]|uniref:Extracellular solute-binding protein n=1 Tax=Hathewaya histolytica TaxID=1498 RepID=A0A4U9REF9_HATHI|nr:spermidine/putrescine ABC transporter substrate-binding protein [Hathewaya histolytica]VTQ89381.1 extracellular solute-binding protein [Hathewaya histolytica]